jgi:hypothetical protein
VTPPLPPWGRQYEGVSPLDPMTGWIFLLRCRSTIHSHAPRGEHRRGSERPWLHRNPIPVPSFSFLKSTISTEQNSSLSVMVPGRIQPIPPVRHPPRPKLQPLLLFVFVTLLYSTSSVPVGDRFSYSVPVPHFSEL